MDPSATVFVPAPFLQGFQDPAFSRSFGIGWWLVARLRRKPLSGARRNISVHVLQALAPWRQESNFLLRVRAHIARALLPSTDWHSPGRSCLILKPQTRPPFPSGNSCPLRTLLRHWRSPEPHEREPWEVHQERITQPT